MENDPVGRTEKDAADRIGRLIGFGYVAAAVGYVGAAWGSVVWDTASPTLRLGLSTLIALSIFALLFLFGLIGKEIRKSIPKNQQLDDKE
jgi:hypothetical protein